MYLDSPSSVPLRAISFRARINARQRRRRQRRCMAVFRQNCFPARSGFCGSAVAAVVIADSEGLYTSLRRVGESFFIGTRGEPLCYRGEKITG